LNTDFGGKYPNVRVIAGIGSAGFDESGQVSIE
jgi:hypothetical protein